MKKKIAVTGNEALAEALRQINPDVCAAYPITPQTDMMQRFSEFVADGLVDTELMLVESEHSAMSACIGASAGGGRVATATSGPGLALMWEMLYVASGMRCPIVMPVINRALSAPLNIHCDHSDAMGARDSGWIQLWSENAQEAYDNMIMAFRIAEHTDIRLPVMVCMDGFIISHSLGIMEFLADDVVRKFIRKFTPHEALLDINHPVSYGPLIVTDQYHEYKNAQNNIMSEVFDVASDVAAEFENISGRRYGFFETYKLEDAEIGIVILNSAAGTCKDMIDEARREGIKIGLLKPRLFRPFPYEMIAAALSHLKVICVLDRSDSFGAHAPLFVEIATSLYNCKQRPVLINRIYGLGGRDFMPEHVSGVINEMIDIAGKKIEIIPKKYISLRK
ncbi:MAG: pyruvate ferredoxin oxidoreductase alpha subunit [Syntrophaceae bacterium]|nr:MAG: pyruvate ferredoxin oxidoreductase alpha subunit [Syntrophaceae bacterium]